MKILFFTLINSSNKGYLNKIESQAIGLAKLGFDVTYTYICNNKFTLVNNANKNEIDIPDGTQWKKRKNQYKILKSHLRANFDVLLIRFNYFDYWILDLLKEAKQQNIRVVCEIPTFPYRNELWNNLFLGLKSISPSKTLASIYRLILDSLMPYLVKKYIHRVFTYSPYKKIWGIDCIEIDNGIHIENISIVTHSINPMPSSFNAIAVGYFQKWHAYERIIEGMHDYYSQNRNKVFRLTFVGKGPDEKKYKNMVAAYNLDEYVTFRGPLYDKDLDDEFDKSNIAISSLGGHTRKTDAPYAPLKSREYCARGIPFIYSYNDKIFDNNQEISLKFPIGDSPIKIEQIIEFCESDDKNEIHRDMMVQFAHDNFSWSKQLEIVFHDLQLGGVKLMRHTFILLNYLNYQDTVNCIKTILNLKDALVAIVIVDNNSKNDSIEKIRDQFPIEKNIHYIQSGINLGFAKGNNLGFNFCKYNIESDFITILNNDTLINDPNFCKKIEEISFREDFDILGPKIITKDGFNQNPQRLHGYTLQELRMKILKMVVMKIILNVLFYSKTYKLVKKIKGHKTVTKKVNHQDSAEIKNVQLHGACLILSKKFISKSKYVFYPETFLYMEEDILYYLGLMENLYFLYSPNLEINHLEDQSTNMLMSDDIRKYLFVYREGLKSARILIKIMKRGIEK